MSSSPRYTVVDQFDEDEFPDIPAAPAALLRALRSVPDPRNAQGRRHRLSSILAVAACAVIAGARSFVAIAEWSLMRHQRCWPGSESLVKNRASRRSGGP